MDLSIVTTLYYSAPYLQEFYERACAAAEKVTSDYEIVFVNDGSPDESLEVVLGLCEKDERVRVIDLSRNFGHHRAIMTGLAHARGELVFLIDCDLEEEPEFLGTFHSRLKEAGADVVYGVQQTRKGGLFERLSGKLFYWTVNLLSGYAVPANLITVRLMTRRYVQSLIEHRDREIFLAGLWAITGYKQVPITVKKHDKGHSTYSFTHKISTLVNAITSSSAKPLVFIFYLGCVIVALSSTAALYLVVRRLFFGEMLAGWPSLIVSIWLLGGLTIFCLGLIGFYISKIFLETKERPYTIIREIHEGKRQA